MKRIILVMLAGLITVQVYATVFTVTVTNFQFTPQNIPNVVVGDVIHFVWGTGFHTTTCDPINQGGVNSLPAGADPWDSPMTSANTSFNYTVTTAGTYNYFCKIHGAGMAGTFTSSSVTPVTLSDFKLNIVNSKPVLWWKTLTEINTDYFSIRKSIDGTHYNETGRVQAAGNSVTEKTYSFTDAVSVDEKYVYYLLYTIDVDGRKQVSETRIFKNPLALPKLIISIGPNPINKPGHLLLKFNADKTSVMLVRVINLQGKTVLKLEMDAVTGINNGHIHLGDLPSGTYIVQCTLNGLKENYNVLLK